MYSNIPLPSHETVPLKGELPIFHYISSKKHKLHIAIYIYNKEYISEVGMSKDMSEVGNIKIQYIGRNILLKKVDPGRGLDPKDHRSFMSHLFFSQSFDLTHKSIHDLWGCWGPVPGSTFLSICNTPPYLYSVDRDITNIEILLSILLILVSPKTY